MTIKLKLKPGLNGLRLREAPVDGRPIGQIYAGQFVESLESVDETRRKLSAPDEWIQVRDEKGQAAYTAAWMLDPVEPLPEVVKKPEQPEAEKVKPAPDAPASPDTGSTAPDDRGIPVRATRGGLRLREAPVDGRPVGYVGRGDVLFSLETADATSPKLGAKGEWLHVRTLYGATAYTAAWFLEAHDGPIPEPPSVPDAPNITGINLDAHHPLGSPDPVMLEGLGWVRLAYSVSGGKGSQDIDAAYNVYKPILEKYARAGYKTVVCFTHQTYGEGRNEYWPWTQMTDSKWRRLTAPFTEMVGRIAAQYAGTGLIDAYQVWNEMDAPLGAVASVPMTAQNYGHLLGQTILAVKASDPNALVISGGHTGGPGRGSAYAKSAVNALPAGVLPDGIAFHPYGRGITGPKEPYSIFGHIDDSMRAYSAILPGRPLWITEWGVLDRENDSSRDILQYATELVNHLKTRYPGQVASLIWYAWAMSMHNGYGLVNRSSQPIQPLFDGFRKL
jgi:hypothetical protein